MTQEEIIDGNKLIAEFMGYKLITPEMRKNPSEWKFSYWENPKLKGSSKGVLCSEKCLSYHSSWDWLMPVVKECFNAHRMMMFHDLSVGIFANNHIEVVWKAVVKFIKWYNTQQK